MTRPNPSSPENPPATSLVERVVLVVLLCLIPLRAVLSETHTFETPQALRSLEAPGSISPAATFAFIAVILACATVVFAIRVRQSTWRWTGAEIGMLLLFAAMVVSTIRAGQKHLAIIGSLDFIALLLYFVTLRQLLTRPWLIRLALVVVLATGGMVVAKCAYQRWIELPATLKYYSEHKSEILAGSGEASAGFIHDYEKRLESGAATGFFAHPNVLGSYLIPVILASLALVAGRFRRRPRWPLLMPGLLATGATIVLAWTQSKGAAASFGIALFLWIGFRSFRAPFGRRPRAAFAAFWSLMLAAAIALGVVMKTRPQTLGLSMLYRSMYWQAADGLLRDQGVLGIGADNFGRFFTKYKPAECPEDVEDPHSWVFRSLTEWGVLGAAGMLLVFAGVSWKLMHAREVATSTLVKTPDLPGAEPVGGSIILWAAAIGLGFLLAWTLELADSPAGFVLLTLHIPLLAWFATFVATSFEGIGAPRFSDDPVRIAAPICAGLVGFVIHTGIDLAMFQGGAATTSFALLAVALSSTDSPVSEIAPAQASTRPTKRKRGLPVVIALSGSVAVIVIALRLFAPSFHVAAQLAVARRPTDARTWRDYAASPQFNAYRGAAGAYRLDATAIDELVEELSRRANKMEVTKVALMLIDEFARRDPHNALLPHDRAKIYFQRFAIEQRGSKTANLASAVADLGRAIGFIKQSIADYPTNPNRRLFLAELLEQRAEVEKDAAVRNRIRTEAAAQLQAALDLDARRIYISKPHRLSDAESAGIKNRIARLRAASP